ncbi:MAG TPA: hypothetical protein VLG92_03910 [Candidatus Saccharimonadia bacterium]|nr:hypothetical protein [Candidatus Saccharimonadia bacterium]
MPSLAEFAMAAISDKAYEKLRLILEKQYGGAFIIEEVKEIGDGLVDFYELLITLSGEEHDQVQD